MQKDMSTILYFTFRNCSQISRWARISSSSFINSNINEIFGPSFALVTQNLLQRPNAGGYVRSKLEMQQIADWAESKRKNVQDLGLIPGHIAENKNQEVERIANVLRDRFMKPQTAAVPEEE